MKAISRCPLGRAIDATFSPHFADDFDWSYVSPDGLSVHDAFAFATTWATTEDYHVDLSHDVEMAEFFVVPTYDRVTWQLDDCCDEDEAILDVATAARASSIVWHALASCRGFRARENPGFWKRVFDFIQRTPGGEHGYYMRHSFHKQCWRFPFRITDELKFFEDLDFPRFRVIVEPDKARRVARVLCGFKSVKSDTSRHIMDQLQGIMSQLGAYVHRPSVHPVEWRFELVGCWTICPDQLFGLAPLCDDHPEGITVHQFRTALGMSRLQWLFQCVKPTDMVEARSFPSLTWCIDMIGSVKTLLGLDIPTSYDQGCLHLSVSLFDSNQWSADARCTTTPPVCSTLPHTRTTESCKFQGPPHWPSGLSCDEFAWLAYALFHPDTPTSTWRYLRLETFSFRHGMHTPVEVLDMMAAGNNLLVAHGLTTLKTDRYFTATIASQAILQSLPSDEGEVVQMLTQPTKMDVCVVSTDVSDLNEWVAVVLVGFGLSWVHRQFVVDDITARLPGRPSLKGLLLYEMQESKQAMMRLIELVGATIEHLTLGDLACHEMLSVVRRSCPRLVSLRLPHLREPWSSFPNVKELEVDIERRSLRFADTRLPQIKHLTTLRLKIARSPTDKDLEEFVRPLLTTNRSLRRFFWIGSGRDPAFNRDDVDYAKLRFLTRAVLPWLKPGLDVAEIGPRVTTVALLGVVAFHAAHLPSLSIARLTNEAVAKIGQFAGSCVPRDLWITGTAINSSTPNTSRWM